MGRVVHFEIQASKPRELIAFYEALFSWKFQQWGTQDYWLIVTGADGTPGINGGLLPRRGPTPADARAVNCFLCTVQVDAVDDALAKAVSLGAVVAVPKMPIQGVGWLAYFKDPDGNLVGITQFDAKAA